MPLQTYSNLLKRGAALAAIVLLAGCSIAKPRTDDPMEKFNRKAYHFNDQIDQAVIRPVAVGYRSITNPDRKSTRLNSSHSS